jgi:hypothetical protein
MLVVRLTSALFFSVVSLVIAVIHVYWGFGGEWGITAAVPTIDGRRVLEPTPVASFVVAILETLAAIVICGRVGLFSTGALTPLFRFGAFCLCGVLAIRTVGDLHTCGLFKTVHGTPFAEWDTRCHTPLCLILTVLAGIVAFGPA